MGSASGRPAEALKLWKRYQEPLSLEILLLATEMAPDRVRYMKGKEVDTAWDTLAVQNWNWTAVAGYREFARAEAIGKKGREEILAPHELQVYFEPPVGTLLTEGWEVCVI